MLTVIRVYASCIETDYRVFLDAVLANMICVPATDDVLMIDYFNVHVSNDCTVWNHVTERIGHPELKRQGSLLLVFCANTGLWIMRTIFQHKNIREYTRHRTELSTIQRALMDFVIAIENAERALFDVRGTRGAKLARNHYVIVGNLRFSSNDEIRKEQSKRKTRIH
jgi:hypothetical protein